MRDRSLLKDILLYLRQGDSPDGLGRLRKVLIARVEEELSLDPKEFERMCGTFIRLFDDPATDCQPTKAWQKLADKTRIALAKPKFVFSTDDPILAPLLEMLESKDTKVKSNANVLFPFRDEDVEARAKGSYARRGEGEE